MSGALLAHKQLTELLKLKAGLEEGTVSSPAPATGSAKTKGLIIDPSGDAEQAASAGETIEGKSIEPKAAEAKVVEVQAVENQAVESQAIEVGAMDAQAVEAKSVEAQAAEAQSVEAQSVEAQSVEAQSVETQSVEAQALEAQALEAQAVEAKSVEAQAVEAKSVEAQAVEAKSVEAQSVQARFLEAQAVETPAVAVPALAVPAVEVPGVEVPSPTASAAVAEVTENKSAVPAQPGHSAVAPEQVQAAPEPGHYATFYDILGVDPLSPFEKIRVRYLKLVTTLIRQREISKDLTIWVFRDRLRTLCVAYDVLRDPNTRTDYDFRVMGLRGGSAAPPPEMPEDVESATSPSRPHLRIGELLQCSELLEPSELDIAVDMHTAMPEMAFGQFLVTQGFLTDAELHSALLGQHLISDGKITVAQFQIGMYGVRETSTPLSETLVSRGWVEPADIQAITIAEPIQRGVPFGGMKVSPQIHEVPVRSQDANGRKISFTNALPSWAQQIDWEETSKSEAAAGAGDKSAIAQASAEGGEPKAREATLEPSPPADETATEVEDTLTAEPPVASPEKLPEPSPSAVEETADSEEQEAADTEDASQAETSVATPPDLQTEPSQSADEEATKAENAGRAETPAETPPEIQPEPSPPEHEPTETPPDAETPVVGSLEETSKPHKSEDREPSPKLAPSTVPESSAIGRDPVVRALQEKLAAIKNKGGVPEQQELEELEAEAEPIVESLDEEPERSVASKSDDAAEPGDAEKSQADEPLTESMAEEPTES